MDTALQNAALAGFAFCLLWAAASDARDYLISNRTIIAIAILFPVHLLARAMAMGSFLSVISDGFVALALAGLVLIAGYGLFAFQLIGGADAKLASAVALWAGPENILTFLIVAALSGGAFSIATLLWQTVFVHAADERFVGRLRRGLSAPVPFGVAIAAAGLFVAARVATL